MSYKIVENMDRLPAAEPGSSGSRHGARVGRWLRSLILPIAIVTTLSLCVGRVSGAVPTSPTNLTATSSSGAVLLQWDNVSVATGYNVYMSTTSGVEAAPPVASVVRPSYSTQPLLVTGLTNLKTYYFIVTAVNAVGEGPASNEASGAPVSEILLHSFGNEGPSGFIEASDGYLYGTTRGVSTGSGTTYGSVYRMDTSGGSFQIMHSFNGSAASDGANPAAGVTEGADGKFYGTTQNGGTHDLGTIFQMDNHGNYSVLYSFAGYTVSDGANPVGGLVQGSDGAFYGTTRNGGSHNLGTVFKIDSTFHLTIIHSFGDGAVTNDGSHPVTGLVLAVDGNLYGTTSNGGLTGAGTIFSMDTAGHNGTVLYSFAGTSAGAGELIQGSDGALYGVTSSGGVSNAGTVFRKETTGGSFQILHSFADGSVVFDGRNPAGRLIQASDNMLYGTTVSGGVIKPGGWGLAGTLFRVNIAGGNMSVLHCFSDTSVPGDGFAASYGMIQAGDGKLYGATGSGSVFNTAFQLDPGLNPLAPKTPTGLTAAAADARVALTWNASFGATGYNVKRAAIGGGPYATVASPTSVSYTNTGLTNGIAYYYVVSAVNAGGESHNSTEMSATPEPPIPAAPSVLSATVGSARVSLAWFPSTSATSYNVKRGTGYGGPYVTVVSRTTTSYVNTGLTNGMTYYFVVTAVNGGGESSNSPQASATPMPTPPIAPTGLAATAGNAVVTLSWNAASEATSYNMRRSTVNGGPYDTIASSAGTSWINSGLTNGRTYYYVVAAVGPGGESPNSAQVAATPRVPAAFDFNGDGLADLVHQWGGSNQISVWFMNNATAVSSRYISLTPAAGWVVAAVNDFNGDNKPDLVLQNPSIGKVAVWYLNGTTFVSGQYVSVGLPAGWTVRAAADFNGDHKPDLVLQNTSTGKIALWYLNGTAVATAAYASVAPPSAWRVACAGDFNSDGKSDLVLQNTSTNKIALWYMNGVTVVSSAYASVTPAAGLSVAGRADYNGDGKAELILQNGSTNQISLMYLSGATVTSTANVSVTPLVGSRVVGPR
jgi:uncharacterized repeat protein (TIGR03803 family)